MNNAPNAHQHSPDFAAQLATFRSQWERNQRALDALYNISIACQGSTSFAHIFDAVQRELHAVFMFDACYIALCDPEQPEVFRAVLLVDEGKQEYEENRVSGPLTGALVRERQPLLFRDLAEERQQLGLMPSPFGSKQKQSRSWLGVPLLVGHGAVGVISIQSYQPDLYDESDVDLLQRFGNIVAVAMENAALDQQQHELSTALADQVAARTVELATLSAVAAELVLQQPLPALLDRALELILALFKLDGGTVRRLDEQGEMLVLLAQRGFSDTYTSTAFSLPVSDSRLGVVARENRPVVVSEGVTTPPQAQQNPHDYVALLSVPLRIGNRVLGTLTLLSSEVRDFAETEIDLAQAVGNQLAIAIQNARLFDERARQINELQALGRISQAASSSVDLPTFMRLVHAALCTVVPFDAFAMVVCDLAKQSVASGLRIEREHEHDIGDQALDPLAKRVLEQREPYYASEHAAERGAESWLGVPLLNGSGAALGVVSVASEQAHAFDARVETFLQNVAAQVSLHVQNIQLVQQRERQIHELNAIGKIGELISASYQFEDMLQGVYQALCDVARPSVFFLAICAPETRVVTNAIFIEQGERIPIDWDGKPPAPGSLTGWIVDQRQPLLFRDLPRERDHVMALGITPRAIGPERTVHSWVGVPLLAEGGEPIGVISLQDYEVQCYDEQTIAFLSQVASHVSLGVQKVRLFAARERQIEENARLFAAEQMAHRTAETLREVARVLNSSFDTREVLQLVLRELHKVLAYDTASIMLVERNVLRIAAHHGLNIPDHQLGDVLDSAYRSGAAQVVRSSHALYIGDTYAAPEWTHNETSAHVRSWLGVPLISRGMVLGVLNIDSCQPNSFTLRDIEVAEAFASHAAVALENARLYEESVTRVEQELAIARQIQSNLFPRTLPQYEGLALAASCLPARETGGDFYDVVELDGALTGFLVGDASGKSIQGAMLMAIARSVARSEARDHQMPELVMRETNMWIARDIPPRSFVALCYATLDLETRQLVLSNAGQITPLHRHADGRIDYLDVPGPTLPIGIQPDIPYAVREVQLEPGDTVVFLTDGIVEARNSSGELYGFERFERALQAYGDAAPPDLIARVLDDVRGFMDGMPQHDDMTLVVLRLASQA
jgi:GAF domain-containing protein